MLIHLAEPPMLTPIKSAISDPILVDRQQMWRSDQNSSERVYILDTDQHTALVEKFCYENQRFRFMAQYFVPKEQIKKAYSFEYFLDLDLWFYLSENAMRA